MQSVCSADQSVLACARCGQFPVNVVETQCSPHCSPLYCWECVVRLDRCVMCTSTIDIEKLRPLPFLRQRLSMLNVRCSNEGCTAVFKTGERDKHERECPYGLVACTISPACAVVRRSELAAHEADCPNRPVVCPEQCGETIIASSLKDHVEACAARLIPCGMGKCAVELRRAALAAHQKECPHREIECILAPMGCTYKGPAQEMNHHLKHETSHWQLVLTEYAKMQARIDALTPKQPEQPARKPLTPEEAHVRIFFVLVCAFIGVWWVAQQTGTHFFCFLLAGLCTAFAWEARPVSPKAVVNRKAEKLRKIFCMAMMGGMAIVWLSQRRSSLWYLIVVGIAFVAQRCCRSCSSRVAHPVPAFPRIHSPLIMPSCGTGSALSLAAQPHAQQSSTTASRVASGKKGV